MNVTQGRYGLAILAALVLLPCIACGGHSSKTQTAVVSLSMTPYYSVVDQGQTLQFTASVSGTSNTAVLWSIQEGNTGGSITAQGLYTAPFTPGTFHVKLTSVRDQTKYIVAEINVRSISVSLTPSEGDMEPGENQQFEAVVTGTVNRAVDWSVSESSVGGLVTGSGLYTAPDVAGNYHVVATSAADKTTSATAAVRVTSVSVSIIPRALAVAPSGTRQFSASVTGTLDDSVLWSVQEGAAGGTITEDGLFKAPAQYGEFHVLASSVSHPGVTGSATVLVTKSDFKNTGSSLEPRTFHTATLLPNGQVLIVGGYGDEDWASKTSAELYDPSSRTFHATGSMTAGRDSHTATLLTNGKVLIAGGGYTDWISHKSAEIYDPSTGIFTPTADMSVRRSNHTATRLQNGKVLIVGGIDWIDDSKEQLRIAELFDPDAGTFSPGGILPRDVWNHTATLLDDGRVLVTGGSNGYQGETSELALVYDPNTATFTEVASMNGSREAHTATLLSGNRVLIAGGCYYSADLPNNLMSIDDAQTFNVSTLQFSSDIEMNLPRSRHTATLLPNKTVLLAGGDTDEIGSWFHSADSSAELFDPASSKFSNIGPMTIQRVGHTATLLLDGTVLIVGGNRDKTAELYVPQ